MQFKSINMDLEKKVIIDTQKQKWIESPSKKVLRIPLEREKAESGHVTSIVKYLPNSKFAAHTHPNGEEIFVLEGVFSDEHGDYMAGSYLRNPPGTSHSPFSLDGCKILVKLEQFSQDDLKKTAIQTKNLNWIKKDNFKIMPLHNFENEETVLIRWNKGQKISIDKLLNNEEFYVITGVFKDETGQYPKGTWVRSPSSKEKETNLIADEETVIFLKTGHFKV